LGALALPGNDEPYEKKDNVDNSTSVATSWVVFKLEKEYPFTF